MELANWYWKAVRQFVLESFGISRSRSSCLNYRHRLDLATSVPRSACSRPMRRMDLAGNSNSGTSVAFLE